MAIPPRWAPMGPEPGWGWDEWLKLALWIATIGFLLTLLVLMSPACKPKIIEKPVPVEISKPCALPPGPESKPALTFRSPPDCPEGYPVCMTAEDAAKLLLHVRTRENWIAEAKAACGGPE